MEKSSDQNPFADVNESFYENNGIQRIQLQPSDPRISKLATRFLFVDKAWISPAFPPII